MSVQSSLTDFDSFIISEFEFLFTIFVDHFFVLSSYFVVVYDGYLSHLFLYDLFKLS